MMDGQSLFIQNFKFYQLMLITVCSDLIRISPTWNYYKLILQQRITRNLESIEVTHDGKCSVPAFQFLHLKDFPMLRQFFLAPNNPCKINKGGGLGSGSVSSPSIFA